MKGTVKFSKEFVTPIGLHEWITLEWPVDEPFDEKKAMETFNKVRDFVCNYQSNGLLIERDSGMTPIYPTGNPSAVIQVKSTEYNEVEETTVETIMACEDLKELDTYKFVVKGNDELQQAFWYREEQLKNK